MEGLPQGAMLLAFTNGHTIQDPMSPQQGKRDIGEIANEFCRHTDLFK